MTGRQHARFTIQTRSTCVYHRRRERPRDNRP